MPGVTVLFFFLGHHKVPHKTFLIPIHTSRNCSGNMLLTWSQLNAVGNCHHITLCRHRLPVCCQYVAIIVNSCQGLATFQTVLKICEALPWSPASDSELWRLCIYVSNVSLYLVSKYVIIFICVCYNLHMICNVLL